MSAFSENGTEYPDWDALVEAEANGYVAVAIINDGKQQWPWVVGPYPTKREATNAKNRLRTKMKKEQPRYPGHTFKTFVRPAWKDAPRG